MFLGFYSNDKNFRKKSKKARCLEMMNKLKVVTEVYIRHLETSMIKRFRKNGFVLHDTSLSLYPLKTSYAFRRNERADGMKLINCDVYPTNIYLFKVNNKNTRTTSLTSL